MGQAKTISRFINILIRDNLLGHNSVSAAPICLVLSGFAELPGLLLKNHGLKNKVTNPGKFSSQTLWESSERIQEQLGKVWKMGPLQKGCESSFPEERRELKCIKRKGNSESEGKKEETHRKWKPNAGWSFTVSLAA